MQSVALGNDHKGFALKQKLMELLKESYNIIDCGTDSNKSNTDYPDFAKKVTDLILENEIQTGILICNTGIGMSIAANRNKGIRAALCYTPEHAKLARLHNDANILVLGAGFISEKEAELCVKTFLSTEFEKGRHTKRIQKIEHL